MCVKGNGEVCGKFAVNGVCSYHERIEANRAEKYQHRLRQQHMYTGLHPRLRQYGWDNPGRDPEAVWDYLTELVERSDITRDHQRRLFRVFMDMQARRINADMGVLEFFEPVAVQDQAAKPVLQQFAEDGQNVHRKTVTDNTNTQTDKLLAVTVPTEQDTLKEVSKLFGKGRKVMADVEHWYAITLCRKEGDCLYKRTLDGLWAMIQSSSHKDELCQRLKEEMTESVGMCCEGHLSRLCNVLVGFDDAFTTVVSKSEILQQKMAAIAALEVTTRVKKMRARKVLQELTIPTSQHADWLDAF